MQDILFTLRLVSKRWKKLIDNSISFQKALFLAPDGDPVLPLSVAALSENGITPDDIPLLEAARFKPLPLFKNRAINATENEEKGADRCLKDLYYEIWTPSRFSAQHFFRRDDLVCLKRKAINIPFAYRSMFFTQPPVTAVSIEADFGHSAVVYNRNGLTLGQIADVCGQLAREPCPVYDGDGILFGFQTAV